MPQSSVGMLVTSSRAPPPSIAQPLSTIGSSRCPRRLIETFPIALASGASAHAVAASAAHSASPRFRLSLNASASPQIAITIPTSSFFVSGSSGSANDAIVALYSGIIPNSTAASPDGTYCSPQ